MRPYGRSAVASLAGRIPAPCTMSRSSSSTTWSSSNSSSSSSSDLAQRSLFVNVRPPPASLAERRSVLGVLERYGKAELFKKLADNSSFVCIASSTAMAAALVQRSPLQYELLAETLQAAQPWGQPRVVSLVQPIETTTSLSSTARSAASTSSPDWSPSSSSSSASSTSSSVHHRSFIVSVFPSQDYHHRTVVRNTPLHGPWPRDLDQGPSGMATIVSANADGYRDTFVYNALRAVVPESASSAALCDWRTRQPAAGYNAAVSSTINGNDGQANSAAARIQERRARRAHASKSILSSLAAGKTGSNNGRPEEIKRPQR